MKIDKDIALGFNFVDAPKNLQDAAAEFKAKFIELQDSKAQEDAWREVRKKASLDADKAFEKVQRLGQDFNPAAKIKGKV